MNITTVNLNDGRRSPMRHVADYFSKRKIQTAIAAATYIATLAIAFFLAVTNSTVSFYNADSFEIGQIADVTITSPIDATIPPSDGFSEMHIATGEKIFRKNFQIDETALRKYLYVLEYGSAIDFAGFARNAAFFFLLLLFALFFLARSNLRFALSVKQMVFIAAIFVANYSFSAFSAKIAFLSSPEMACVISLAPFCVFLSAIIVGTTVASGMAFLLSFTIFSTSNFSAVPLVYSLAVCLFAVKIAQKAQKRADLFWTSLLFAITCLAVASLIKLCFPHFFSTLILPASFMVGFLSGILSLGCLSPLELAMGTASVFRLRDLSDVNNPTMKKMLLNAPGTYNHTTMVAALAEAACADIGANPLLARVGAYYHDLGKLDHPEYFTENQDGTNIHDTLNPSLSVSIIRRHVKRGVEKARELHLPDDVVTIINEHHGNSVIAYFYNEAKKVDENASEEDYSYIGNPPSTRESAVVMLADTVEAACRSLDKPSVPRLESFIDTLVNAKMGHGQLDNSSLMFKDLDIIKKSFVTILAGFYHSRVKYPNQKDVEPKSEGEIDASARQSAHSDA